MRWSAISLTPVRSSTSSTASGAGYSEAIIVTSSRTDRSLISAPVCSIAPTIPRATAWLGDLPNTDTLPPSGVSRPNSMSIVVDLPAPLGPKSATVSPAAMRTSTPRTARIGPSGPWKDLTSPLSSISDPPCACASAAAPVTRSCARPSFARHFDRLLAFDLRQHHLARTHAHGSHLDGLVLAHELQRFIERQFAVSVQAHEHI